MSAPVRILLIDDHASTREPLAFMLEQEPDLTVVAQAGSLAEARAALEDDVAGIDLAVVDLGLPDGCGEELIPELRTANPDAAALVLTYFSDCERQAGAVAAGILHKSASVMEVVDALRTIDQERRRDREANLSFEQLTERELDVLQALADGLSDKEIAERLYIGAATVRSHVISILGKLQASSHLQALVLAVRHNIVTID